MRKTHRAWARMIFSLCVLVQNTRSRNAWANETYFENPALRRERGQVALAPLSDISSFDPGRGVDSVTQFWLGHTFEGLTTKGARGAIVPAAAQRWDIASNGKSITFHLRPGLVWHDGVPLKAPDFVYAWRRLADPSKASEYGFVLRTAGVRNAAAILDGKAPPEMLGVFAEDDRTLKVELDAPSALLLELVSLNVFFPVRRDLVEKWGAKFGVDPASVVGNGPYKLTSWIHDGPLLVEKAPNYWNAKAIAIRSITLPFASSSFLTAYQAFVTGKIDVDTALDADVFHLAAREKQTVQTTLAGAQWYLLFNVRKGAAGADPALRESIAASLDRREYITKIHALPGARAAFGLVPDYIAGSDPSATFRSEFPMAKAPPPAGGKKGTRTPALAPLLRFVGVGNDSNKIEAEWFEQKLERATGADVRLELPPFKVRLQKLRDGDFDVAMASWIPDYDDPLTFLEVFESKSEANASGWSDARFDALVREARTMPRGTARSSKLREAEALLLAARVAVPYRQSARIYLVADGLVGVERRALGLDPDLRAARWAPLPAKGLKGPAPRSPDARFPGEH